MIGVVEALAAAAFIGVVVWLVFKRAGE